MALATVLCFVLALMPARLSASRIKESKSTRKIVSRAATQFASPTIPNESPDNVPRYFKFATPPLTWEDVPDKTETEAFEAFKAKAFEAKVACNEYYADFVCTGSASVEKQVACDAGCGALWCGFQYSTTGRNKGKVVALTLARYTAKCAEADLATNFPEHANIPEKE